MRTIYIIRDYKQIPREEKSIEQALQEIPEEYRQGVFDNIMYHTPYPLTAHYKTWQKWKQRLIYKVAYELVLRDGFSVIPINLDCTQKSW